MNEKKEIRFSIENPRKEFEEHLNLPDNDRIIFSAPFGMGKTYFLKEFFENHPDYDVIHIYPVNYSVAANNDIFELIKYDILFELLGKKIKFEKVDFSKLDFLPFFIKDNKAGVFKVLTPLLSVIPVIGKSISGVSDRMIELGEKFDEELKKVQIDDNKSIIEYLKNFKNRPGNIYEEDFYTELIQQLINQLKEGEKETVLIVDDLDRVDPEHIFRILNVFSAHMDKTGHENKFGFDKIILVFDQENVRNMFHNRYGVNVDYIGYIDKFYSYKPFVFNNPEGLRAKIHELLNRIKGVEQFLINEHDNEAVVFLLEMLVTVHAITPRRLIKILDSNFEFKGRRLKLPNVDNEFHHNQFFIFFLIQLLLHVFEEWELLLESFEKLSQISIENPNWQLRHKLARLMEYSLIILDWNNHSLIEDHQLLGSKIIEYSDAENTNKIKYNVSYNGRELICTIPDSMLHNISYNDMCSILLKTTRKIREENLLNKTI